MNSMTRLVVFVGTLAIIAALGGLTYLMKWAGPGFASGFIAGGVFFFGVYKMRNGKWPD